MNDDNAEPVPAVAVKSDTAEPVAVGSAASVRHSGRLVSVAKYWQTPALLAVIVVVVAILAPAVSNTLTTTTITFLIYLMIVVGLNVFVGNSGVISFGHLSFMAVGAYVWMLLAIPTNIKHVLYPSMPSWLAHAHASTVGATFIAVACAALAGLLVGLVLGRLDGIAASIGTFALLLVVQVVLSNWTAVTNGTVPLSGAPTNLTVPTALVWAVVVIFVAFMYRESRSGLRLRASREDDAAARSVGVHTFKERVVAFALSGAIVGLAGALYADYLGAIYPSVFFLDLTLITLAMLVVGGLRSVSGAVIGALFIQAVTELFTRSEQGISVFGSQLQTPPGSTEIAVAVIILLVLILRPSGITGGNELRIKAPPWRRRSSANR